MGEGNGIKKFFGRVLRRLEVANGRQGILFTVIVGLFQIETLEEEQQRVSEKDCALWLVLHGSTHFVADTFGFFAFHPLKHELHETFSIIMERKWNRIGRHRGRLGHRGKWETENGRPRERERFVLFCGGNPTLWRKQHRSDVPLCFRVQRDQICTERKKKSQLGIYRPICLNDHPIGRPTRVIETSGSAAALNRIRTNLGA